MCQEEWTKGWYCYLLFSIFYDGAGMWTSVNNDYHLKYHVNWENKKNNITEMTAQH